MRAGLLTRSLTAVTTGLHLGLAWVVGVPLVLAVRLARALRFGEDAADPKVERPLH